MAKAKSKTSKVIVGETSQDAIDLAADESALDTYAPILQAYLDDPDVKGKLYKGASKNVAAEVEKFVEWLNKENDEGNLAVDYRNDELEDRNVGFVTPSS